MWHPCRTERSTVFVGYNKVAVVVLCATGFGCFDDKVIDLIQIVSIPLDSLYGRFSHVLHSLLFYWFVCIVKKVLFANTVRSVGDTDDIAAFL